jgi:hypothetical protein
MVAETDLTGQHDLDAVFLRVIAKFESMSLWLAKMKIMEPLI